MAAVDVERHHQDLVDELIAAVEAYNPDVDKELSLERLRFRRDRPRGPGSAAPASRSSHHPFGAVAKICAELHLDEQTLAAALLHDVVEDTGRRARRAARPSSATRSLSSSRASPS